MDPVKLTPGQQRVVDEAPLRQEIARLKRERDEALERLGPVDPGGSDRIDELESAIGLLRHRVSVAQRERDEARAQRDALAKELKWIGENATDVPIADAAFRALAGLDEGSNE